jgi:hypothetical protein
MPSHSIGIALDGYPTYGGRDLAGKVIAVSQLDACNRITGPTPEIPGGAYHYVLPIGVTGARSSLNCHSVSASAVQLALSRSLGCITRGLARLGAPGSAYTGRLPSP